MDRFVPPRSTLPTENLFDTLYRLDSTSSSADTSSLSSNGFPLPPVTVRTTTTTNPNTTGTPNATGTTNTTTVNIAPTSSVRTGQALDLWVSAAATRAVQVTNNGGVNGGGALNTTITLTGMGGPSNFFRNMNTTLNDTYNQSTTAWVSGASPSMRRTHGQLLQRELLQNNNYYNGGGDIHSSPGRRTDTALIHSITSSTCSSLANEAYHYTSNNDEELASAGSNRTLSSASVTANAMNRVLNHQYASANINSQGHVTFLSRSDNVEEGYDDTNDSNNNSNITNIENLDASFAAAGGRPFILPSTTGRNNNSNTGGGSSSSITNSPMRSPLQTRILQLHGSATPSRSNSDSLSSYSSSSLTTSSVASSSTILPTLSSSLRTLASSSPNPHSLDHIRSLALSPLRAQFTASSENSSSSSNISSTNRYKRRHVGKVPYKVLDAPALADDFYLNLLDWSSQNILVVGLGSDVYMWNAYTAKVTKLANVGTEDAVTSVAWTQKGGHVAIGTDKGTVQIWDATQAKLIRTMTGHTARVGSQSWAAHVLATGGRDKTICIRDVRSKGDVEHRLIAHKQEVCGLKWSPDWSQLASGGNDNRLYLWSLAMMNGGGKGTNTHSNGSNGEQPTSNIVPLMKFTQHTAAIKALAWSPHRAGLLASGGGTSDKCIRFFNTNTGLMEQVIDTGSQVCQLEWSPHLSELVSCHGYSTNSVTLWRYPDMNKIATLSGHTTRVLYMAMSPDGQSIVTGAGDETLRFWYVFPPSENYTTDELPSSLLLPTNSNGKYGSNRFNNNTYAAPIMDIR